MLVYIVVIIHCYFQPISLCLFYPISPNYLINKLFSEFLIACLNQTTFSPSSSGPAADYCAADFCFILK